MLLDAHANLDHVDNDGCAALHYAASTGNSALVAMLMGYGADTNVTDTNVTDPGSKVALSGDGTKEQHRVDENATPTELLSVDAT